MIFKIAWRNVWRSRTRSGVVIGAIAIGVWSVIFLMSFSEGMIKSYIDNAIENEISHIQIHHPEYLKETEAKFTLPSPDDMVETIGQNDHIKAITSRSMTNGMLATSHGVRGLRIRGVDPEKEALVTHLDGKVIEGEYFPEGKRNPILISQTVAEKVQVKLRSKVVLTFQDLNGDITSGAFRVAGIYETENQGFDQSYVFCRKADLNRLLGDANLAHEIAIILESNELADTTAAQLRQQYADLEVQTYKQISPEIELFNSQIQMSSYIFIFIFMLALIFGIVNTMLMAVLERIKELGMLMAIGMNKVRVFFMIVLETLILGIVGAPIGILIGWGTLSYFSERGMDLSAWSEGMREFGMSEVVYPSLSHNLYLELTIAVLITALIASLYPALKAIRLRPVEALHRI
jgi:putative ABC transport system permease protein